MPFHLVLNCLEVPCVNQSEMVNLLFLLMSFAGWRKSLSNLEVMVKHCLGVMAMACILVE